MRYIFGPVPSRRLGSSLGVNNIPKKHCSYNCIYCQVGRTTSLTVERKPFFEPDDIVSEVVSAVNDYQGVIDYISFVPDGEPTVDMNLGKIIKGIKKQVKIKVAVITNSSLIEAASQDLMEADLVSLKIDAGTEDIYRKVNRPHPSLSLPKILKDMEDFSKVYKGIIITETMLLDGINDGEDNLKKVSEVIKRISPQTAYIGVPVRPLAEPWVKPSKKIFEWYDYFKEVGLEIHLLNYQEEGTFGTAGFKDPAEGILKIVAVHPLREDYAREILAQTYVDLDKTIDQLITEGKIRRVAYQNKSYLVLGK